MRRVSGQRAFTLIELMLVVAIIGLLAAMAIPGFGRYLKRSKTAEAHLTLNRLFIGAMSYYESDHMSTNLPPVPLPKQFPASVGVVYCCNWATGKCPGGDPMFKSSPWVELAFDRPDPYLFAPSFNSIAGASPQFTAYAIGDLNCDNTRSMFVRKSQISKNLGALNFTATAVYGEETD